MNEPQIINNDFENESLLVSNSIIEDNNGRVGFIHDKRWNDLQAEVPLSLDYLYVAGDYKGTIASLKCLFNSERVIIDASLPMYRQSAIIAECDTLGLDYISLRTQGSFLILP